MPIPAFTTPSVYGRSFSLSGSLNDLTMVGKAASPSATMLKNIAIFPILVNNHRAKPRIDKIPQIMSNFVKFQVAFLLKNEAIKIRSGQKPTIKVAKEIIPTPC